MPDVFPDFPDHPDYLPLVAEVSAHVGLEPKLRVDRLVRLEGMRKSRQTWVWAWREIEEDAASPTPPSTRHQYRLQIDVNDAWHGEPWNYYEVMITGTAGLYITLETRRRPPITPLEVRRGLQIMGLLPPVKEWVVATEEPIDEVFVWDSRRTTDDV